MYLGALDVLFAVGTTTAMICLLLSAVAARRRILTG